jgi:hypothetical protein
MAEGVVSSQNPIELQVQLTPDDYARYFAIGGQQQSSWTDFAIYAGAFFMAIPAAFVAEALAASRTGSPVVIALVGRFSLFAFLAGLITLSLAMWIVRRRAIAATLSSTPNAFEVKTVRLDESAVTMTGKLSQTRWTWPAITGVTAEQGLLLFWIGTQSAVVIPDRAFKSPEERDAALALARSRVAQSRSAQAGT